MKIRVVKTCYMLERKREEEEITEEEIQELVKSKIAKDEKEAKGLLKKEVFYYDDFGEAVRDIGNYVESGVGTEKLELTELNIAGEELEARVVPWAKIFEELHKPAEKL